MRTTPSYFSLSWVSKIFPIHRSEIKKFFPLLLLKFLITFVYALLTCMKDTLVVMADHSGAEVIPVIKAWVVFPLSIACAVIYAKLSNHVKQSTLFYGIITFFLLIVFLYAFILYPNASFFTPTKSADYLTRYLGEHHKHWISIYRNWIHTLFFVTAELWGQIAIILLYWGFANHICQVKEAKRSYALFAAAGNIGSVVAGPFVLHYANKYFHLDFSLTLQSVVYYVLFSGIAILALYFWMQKYVLSDRRYYDPGRLNPGQTLSKKTKLSLLQSVKHIFSSKYLFAIAVLVIGCSLSINIVEVTWKAHLKLQYVTSAAYQAFVAKQTFFIGIFSSITALVAGSGFLRRFGWRISAQITPIAVGSTAVIFFLLCIFKDHLTPFCSLFGITPLAFIVFFGAFQSIANRATKYSFFDATKEIVYIPLDEESKVKGKAAIDLVGSRFGKSGSSWIQLLVIELIGTGSILFASPYFLPIIVGITGYWIYSVHYLNRELKAKESFGKAAVADKNRTTLPTGKKEPEPTI